MIQIIIRSMKESDKKFIYSSFISNISKQKYMSKIDYNVSNALLSAFLDKVLQNVNVLVAANALDPDQLFSYLIYKEDKMLYIFTKFDMRRLTIATQLVNRAFDGREVECVLPTRSFKHFKDKWNMVVNTKKLGEL